MAAAVTVVAVTAGVDGAREGLEGAELGHTVLQAGAGGVDLVVVGGAAALAGEQEGGRRHLRGDLWANCSLSKS